jgi:SOS-response transcriptional repressor LexA
MSHQTELLEQIEAFISGNGYAPTWDELAELIGKSKSTVQRNLELMRAKGLVTWKDGQARTLSIVRGK